MREAAAVAAGKAVRDVTPLCEWVDGTKRFALHLLPGLMARLGIETWMAFKQVPRRGLEIGGILLGRTEVQGDYVQVWVEGYRAVESEHRSGPSYLLSEADLDRLREEVRRSGSDAIGLFRTHTRSEEPSVEPPDAEMLPQFFDRGMAVFLLLAPAAEKAVFFARAQSALKAVYQCAVPSSLSAIMAIRQERTAAAEERRVEAEDRIARILPAAVAESRPVTESPSNVAAEVDLQRSPPPPPALARQLPLDRKTWLTAMAAAILTLLVIAGGLAFVSRRSTIDSFTPPFLRLTVQPAGSSLRLNWDPSARVLQGSVYAILHVDDGGQTNDRPLSVAELQNGVANYQPRSNNVTFRLDVYPSEPKASGLVQVLNFGPSLTPAVQPAPLPAPSPQPEAHLVAEQRPNPGRPSNEQAALKEVFAGNENSARNENSAPKRAAVARAASAPLPVAANLRGISAEALTIGVRSRLRLPVGASGVVVTAVSPATPAYEALLQEGDVIEEVDRKPVAGVAEFERAMNSAGNTAVLLSVSREGALSFHAVPAP